MKPNKLRCLASLALALALALSLAGCLPDGPSSCPDWDQEGLRAALELCVSYGPGEAGVSLKTVVASCGLLDWAEDNPDAPDGSDITHCVEDWLSGKELATRQLFWENWPGIDQQAREIVDDPEAQAELLESAGHPQRHDCYTLGRYSRLADCVTACEDC